MHSMHSLSAENLNSFQSKDLGTPIQIVQNYFVEKYPLLFYWCGVYAVLLMCGGIRGVITLLSYTQQ